MILIAMEGPDNTGKTTLGSHLAYLMKFNFFANPEFKEYFKQDIINITTPIESLFLYNFIKRVPIEPGLIIDRSFISEVVYSKVYNRYTDVEQLEKLYNLYSKIDFRVIYCYKTTYKEYVDELISFNNIKTIEQGYDEYFSNHSLFDGKVFKLDTTSENLTEQVDILKLNFLEDIFSKGSMLDK